MATFKDLHIENSKNYKRWYYSAAHWHTVTEWSLNTQLSTNMN